LELRINIKNKKMKIILRKYKRLLLSLIVVLLGFSVNAMNVTYNDRQAVITVNKAKMRSCQGLSCSIVGLLVEGTVVEIIEEYHKEIIGKYGEHPWYKIKQGTQIGYIFGGLLKQVGNSKIKKIQSGLAKMDTNLRSCPSWSCDKLMVVANETYFTLLEVVKGGWIKVKLLGNTNKARVGYLHKKTLDITEDYLIINFPKINIYDKIDGIPISLVKRGERLQVNKRAAKSAVKRPYGRYYWYKVTLVSGKQGWIFGAGTTKEKDPVDCQCVDYVKRRLQITGPTKNAFEWNDVLLGQITVEQNHKKIQLQYKEIFTPTVNSIAVFDTTHQEVHPLYGHVGIVKEVRSDKGNTTDILIEGGNQKVPVKYFYEKMRCGNVSRKWYKYGEGIRFFYKK